MRHQLELAYVGIEVPDPASLTPFFADVIGLVPGEAGPAGTVTWRNDAKAQRVAEEAGKSAMTESAKGTDRVRSVQNELVVAPPSELGSRSNDTYLTSVVKTRFHEATDKFSATHIKVITDRGVV